MHCDHCGKANREGAKFCSGCGGALTRACPACGAAVEPDARFCDACAAPLTMPAASAGDARKVVTVVFADLAGSTPLHEQLDPESARQLMDRYYAAMTSAVEDHRGTVVKLLGDGVMAAFGVPHVAEDDAVRAVRAAAAMQIAFAEVAASRPSLGPDFGLRVGVNTGEVVVSAADDDIVGDPVNVASRLQEHAGLGEVLLGESTRRLVQNLVTLESSGELSLKGRAERVSAHRLVSLDPPVTGATTRLVGRDGELHRLQVAFDDVAGTRAVRLITVLGSPGLGKTRLLDEFVRRVGDVATVLSGRCDAAGVATFAPIAEALRDAAGIGDAMPTEAVHAALGALVPDDELDRDRVIDRVGGLLGVGSPGSPEETFWAVRRLLAGVARERPVVLVLDDLHWAEPLLLDLIEHVVEWSRDVPLLVLCATRPELRDTRSSLASPGGVADVIALDPLDAGAATQLAADVLGAQELPATVAGRVLAASEGNPLFVRELVRMLVDDEVLRRDGDRWVAAAELAEFEMPPTIHALLAARIERLPPGQRAVIERAAVVGKQFTRAALDHLVPSELAPELDGHLEALRRSELVEPDGTWFLGDPVLRFHHALIRDAAYRRVLKGTRAELHERYADWLEGRIDEAAPDRDDLLGWHLEQAHRYVVELDADDEHAHELGRRAARHLAAAGKAALERDDLTVAASLLGRALERVDQGEPAFAELQLDRCEALLAAGEVGTARLAIETLELISIGSPRLVAWHTAFSSQLAVLTEPERLPEIVEQVAPAAAALREAGDITGEAKGHFVHAMALARLGQVGAAESALDHALAAASRSAGDRRLANAVLSGAPLAALWGPSPVTRASGRCLDVVRVLRITAGAPAVEAVALRCQAVLEALRGRVDAARRMIGSARRTLEELGLTHRMLETEVFAGLIELYDGDAEAAEAHLRPAFEQLRDRGLGGEAAQAAALLARALLLQDRDDEADTLGHDAEALAGADLKASIAWRGVRAETAARRGETVVALELARAAVERTSSTDALLDHADARLALAAVLRRSGEPAAAASEAQRAAELYDTKGATLLALQARGGNDVATAPPRSETAIEVAPVTRHVRENLATLSSRQIAHAMTVGDHDELEALFADGCTYSQFELGETANREKHLAMLKAAPPGGRAEIEILATPSDRLSLEHVGWWFPSMRVGESTAGEASTVLVVITEVDDVGRATWTAGFPVERLDAAVAALYERLGRRDVGALLDGLVVDDVLSLEAGHVLFRAADPDDAGLRLWTFGPDGSVTGPERFGVDDPDAAFARVDQLDATSTPAPLANAACRVEERFVRAWAAHDWDAVVSTFADDYHWSDRRPLVKVELEAREALATTRQVFDTAESEWRPELVATRGDRLALFRYTLVFADGDSGLSEVEMLIVVEVDDSGTAASRAVFDPDELDAAYRELDDRYAARQAIRFENAACRLEQRFADAWAARDWDAVVATFADDYQWRDRRSFMQLDSDAESLLATLRLSFGMAESGWHFELIATRGDRLALFACTFSFADSVSGPAELECLNVIEVDDSGRAACRVWFDPDSLDAAFDELDTLFVGGEGAELAEAMTINRRFHEAYSARDWAAFDELLNPEAMFEDHRLLGWGTLDHDGYIATLRSLTELAPDASLRTMHILAARPPRGLSVMSVSGAQGTAFETPFLLVTHNDDRGRVLRLDFFALDQLDAAWARYREIDAPSPFENLAARQEMRFVEAWAAHDWDAVASTFASNHHWSDRRSVARTELARGEALASMRQIFDVSESEWRPTLVATRGDRLALFRYTVTFTDREAGASEVRMLMVFEVGTTGHKQAAVTFDPDDFDAAFEELDARFVAGEGAAYAETIKWGVQFRRAHASRDWTAMAEHFAPSAVFRDHRPFGWGDIAAEEFVASVQTLTELAPDARLRWNHIPAFDAHRALIVSSVTGAGEAGPFEIHQVGVMQIADDGRILSLDNYDLDQLDEAWARYREIDERSPFENAACRNNERFIGAFRAHDWDAVVATLGDDYCRLDRRALAHLDLDRDAAVESARLLFELDVSRWDSDLLATRGERLALFRQELGFVGWGAGSSELEMLVVLEVDEAGKTALTVFFDTDDLDAAYTELDDRYAVGEAAPLAERWAAMRAFARGYGRLDLARAADSLGEGFVVHDHRRLGWGELDKAGYKDVHRAINDLSPDAVLRYDHVLGLSARGAFAVTTTIGAPESGQFEIPFVAVNEIDGAGVRLRTDFYDLEQLDEARARYEEIATPSVDDRFANDATRAMRRMVSPWDARDWDGVVATFSPAHRMEDRRFHITIENAGILGSLRPLFDMAVRHWFLEPVATRGDRLALFRVGFSGEDRNVGPLRVDYLDLLESDGEGRRLSQVAFDPDDLDAAYEELDDRFAAGEAAPHAEVLRSIRVLGEAVASGTWADASGVLTDDFVVSDHRATSLGRMARDEFIGTREIKPIERMRLDHVPRLTATAAVLVYTSYGDVDGGAYEAQRAAFVMHDGARVRRVELFEAERLADALRSFDQLPRIPSFENAVTRQRDRFVRAWRAHDWNAVSATFADNHRMRDRRSMVRLDYGDGEELTDLQKIFDTQAMAETFELLATRGERLALFRSLIIVSRRTDSARPGVYESMGPAEIGRLVLHEVDEDERFVVTEVFDAEDLDGAYEVLDERYEASLRVPNGATFPAPNAASRLTEQVMVQFANRDFDALLDACAETMTFDDRRPLTRNAGDRTTFVESNRFLADLHDLDIEFEIVATAGDRLALLVFRYIDARSGVIALEHLSLNEVDAEGRFTAFIVFELDQRDEAMRELHRRFRRGEGAAFVEVLDTLGRHTAAMQRHDWPAMAQVLDPHVVVDDRRFAGIGLVVGRDQYLDALAALHELSADLTIEAVAILALDTHAIVTLSQTHGHLAEGGGVVENALVFLGAVADGRVTRIEMFDRAEVGVARARFEELRPEPLAIPPNSASRTQDAVSRAREAGDWDGMRALCAPGMVFCDHQRGVQVDGDQEALVGTNRSIGRRARREATWLATMGDRLALCRVRFSSDWQGTEWEVELLGLYEVDEQGLILRNDSFSVEDRAKAFTEMERRFLSGEARPCAAGQAPIVAFDEAFSRRDWGALRAVLADEFVATDQRPGWMGTSEAGEYVESMRVFAELSPDAASETMRVLAWGDHGRVAMTRVTGTQGDAGPYENVFVWMLLTGAGKVRAIEVWPAEDLDAAVKKFEKSRPQD